MKNQDFIAENIPEFLDIVQTIKTKEDMCWYRGHKDVRYKLAPTLYRDSELVECGHDEMVVCSANTSHGTIPYKFKRNQELAFSIFKKFGLAFVQQQPKNDFEWLVLMQHYGGDTQLLDWTSNPLVSLYFALNNLKFDPSIKKAESATGITMTQFIQDSVNNNEIINTYDFYADYEYSDFAVVYIINPLELNNTNLKIDNPRVVVSSNRQFEKILDDIINIKNTKYYYPICVEAPKYDRRAYIQGSGFTLHGLFVDGLDWYANTNKHIYKIYIPNEHGIAMRKELRETLGFTHSFIYQDLTNVVKDAYELHT